MLLRPVTFVDTFAAVARLHRLKASFEEVLVLREADGTESTEYAGWHSLKRLVKTAQFDQKVAGLRIERLKAGTATEWARDPAVTHRVVCALVTNPLAFVHCRAASAHIPAGGVWLVESGDLCCETNWGQFDRYHLVADLLPQEAVHAP